MKHYERECRIMDMVKQIVIHDFEVSMGVAVNRAIEFDNLRERRLDSADAKDGVEKTKL